MTHSIDFFYYSFSDILSMQWLRVLSCFSKNGQHSNPHNEKAWLASVRLIAESVEMQISRRRRGFWIFSSVIYEFDIPRKLLDVSENNCG